MIYRHGLKGGNTLCVAPIKNTDNTLCDDANYASSHSVLHPIKNTGNTLCDDANYASSHSVLHP